jgi:hypothetical protein
MMMLNGTELKASTVLQAMVTGLIKSQDDPDFRVKMATFGRIEDQLCHGCAANLALAEMFGGGRSASELMFGYAKTLNYKSNYIHANLSAVIKLEPLDVQDSSPIDIKELECNVDFARLGDVSLLIFFLTGELNKSFDGRWLLEDEDWEEQLPEVEATIAEMIVAGY